MHDLSVSLLTGRQLPTLPSPLRAGTRGTMNCPLRFIIILKYSVHMYTIWDGTFLRVVANARTTAILSFFETTAMVSVGIIGKGRQVGR